MTSHFSTICVFCGSADGLSEIYLSNAHEVGKLIATNGITLVYGGGKTGLMGSVADGALQARGHVIGVVPEYLNQPQLIHSSLSQLEIVTDIHLRKARMSALADAFIALPGGFGTLEELFEALAAAQTGLHQKPIALLNINHYYDPLISFIDQASRQRFIYPEHRQLLLVDDSANGVFEKLEKYTTPKNLERWINR